MKRHSHADINSMKSKVNPRLLIVLGVVLLLLGTSSDSQPALDGGSGGEAQPEAPEASDADLGVEAEPPIDGTPVVADEDHGDSEWAAQANAICGQAIEDLLAQEAPATPEAAAALLEDARMLVDELGALTPPPGAEAEAAEFVSLLSASLDAAEQLLAAGESGELSDLDQLTGVIEEQAVTQARLAELGTMLGVEACLSGAAESGTGDIVTAGALEADSGARGLLRLQNALLDSDSVVLVVYSPSSELDARVVREARAAANGGGAGFVAVNGTREAQVALLAEVFSLRETPTTLVVNKGLVVSSRFSGFADRETVAQAVRDSLEAS
jgi:hypothetical protein